MFQKRIIFLMFLVLSLTACRGGSNDTSPDDLVAVNDYYALPRDTSGELTVMMWAGSGVFIRDVGRIDIASEDITGSNDAKVISVAREFNKIYPNIIINVNTTDADNWALQRENFRLENGSYPDLFGVQGLIGDIERGVVADISIFADDPRYQILNPSIMELMNIGERQFGVPSYIIPSGVFVNRQLAERENIDIPSPNWTIEQMIAFMSNSRANDFYGGMGAPWFIMETGTRDIFWQLAERGINDPFVRLNSQPIRELLNLMQPVNDHMIWSQNARNNISNEFMEDGWWWGPRFFVRNQLLTLDEEPWMVGDMAHPEPETHWFEMIVDDWDIYPKPSTNYVSNHVNIVFNPLGIRNYAMDDSDPNLSTEEYERLAIAWEFAAFKTVDTKSWKAQHDLLWNSGGGLVSAANTSFPFVTGQAFYDQMEYSMFGANAILSDPVRMPGFQQVIELFLNGQFPSFSHEVYPWHYEFEGSSREIMYEWINKWDASVTGASDLEPHWLDELYARLPEWDIEINKRFENAMNALYLVIDRNYPEQVLGGR